MRWQHLSRPRRLGGRRAPAGVEGFEANALAFFKDLVINRTVVILLMVFIVALFESGSTEWNQLAAASGGTLVGLLGPSPKAK